MTLEFTRAVQHATFYSPIEDFAEVTVDVEVRDDPLTGRTARIVPESFLTTENPDIEEVVANDEHCFFCPGTVEEVTPKYPDWVGFDRGHAGEATSFPNLNPYGAHSNVVALTEAHYVPVDEFAPAVFENGLRAALEFVRAALDHDETATVASVNMNYLRPAGSSIIHPHLQTLVDDRGTNEARLRIERGQAYHDDAGTAYWADLVDEERDGERYVGSTGTVDWLAPFAPKHHRHVLGVADATGVPAPDGAVVGDLAAGIAAVLAGYGAAGHNSFNFALHLVDDDPACPPVIDIVGRSVFDRYYWSDSPFFTVLHDEGVVDVAPETYAAELREHF